MEYTIYHLKYNVNILNDSWSDYLKPKKFNSLVGSKSEEDPKGILEKYLLEHQTSFNVIHKSSEEKIVPFKIQNLSITPTIFKTNRKGIIYQEKILLKCLKKEGEKRISSIGFEQQP